MLNPQSKGYFQAAISNSGSSFCPWAFTRNPREQAVRLGNQLGCPTNNSEQLVECLVSLDPWELIQPQEKLLDIFIDPQDMFGPSVENVTSPELKATAFLTDYPYKLAAEGRTHPVPYISGVNSHEGCYRSAWFVGAPSFLNRLNTDWENVASSAFLLFQNDSQTFDKVRAYHFGEEKKEITISDYEPLTTLIGDRFFAMPARDAALLHAKLTGAPTYLYYFTEKVEDSVGHFLSTISDDSWLPRFLQMAADVVKRRIYKFLNLKIQDFGSCHADEMMMFVTVVPTTVMDIKPGHPQYEFSKKLIKVWTSFARNGKPDQLDGVTWDKVNLAVGDGNSTTNKVSSTSPIPKYLHINSNRPEMIDEPFHSRLSFWHELKLPRNLSPDQEQAYSHDIMKHKRIEADNDAIYSCRKEDTGNMRI
ncbi:Venom carboxylesterase-6 [Orchesella cincta]|uniref:Venom carboxylesterase-6 n=1 Tax=Orchesella cincta TaxID=48709 RepID=A0A1D2N194_ORCCI|nr:Venom carboxylesterase-6 [Orchesella cincta]